MNIAYGLYVYFYLRPFSQIRILFTLAGKRLISIHFDTSQ